MNENYLKNLACSSRLDARDIEKIASELDRLGDKMKKISEGMTSEDAEQISLEVTRTLRCDKPLAGNTKLLEAFSSFDGKYVRVPKVGCNDEQ